MLQSSQSLRSTIVLAGLVAALIGASGCGRKGNPIPPPSKVPAAPSDVAAQQQGSEIVLRFSYPSVTESGLPLTEIESVEVLAYQRSAPELLDGSPMEEPPSDESDLPEDDQSDQPAEVEGEDSDEGVDEAYVEEDSLDEDSETSEAGIQPLPRIDARTFAALAGVVLEMDGEELNRHVDGNQVILRLRNLEFHTDPWIHAYAVTVHANGRNSRPSNIAVVNPVQPPAAITSTEVEGSEEGVRVRWQLLDDPSVTGYRVYRRSAEDTAFGQRFGNTAADQGWFVDTSAELGARWVYAVTAVGPRGVESDWGNQREIFYRDVYPPAQPTALVAIPDAAGVRLLWRHQPPADHAGYVVTRLLGDVTETLTETPVSGLEFTDSTAVSGSQYTYRVVAVDQRGNPSEASEPVTVIAP